MTADIEEIKAKLKQRFPAICVRQLVSAHPADDDGLWFFTVEGREVQVESASGNAPFLVESCAHPRTAHARSVEEAMELVVRELGLTEPT